MFTTRTPDGEFIALPVEDENFQVEFNFDGIENEPLIVISDIDKVHFAKVLTLQEISDMIDALEEVKSRLRGK